MEFKKNATLVIVSTIFNICLVAWFTNKLVLVESLPRIGGAQLLAVDRQESCSLLEDSCSLVLEDSNKVVYQPLEAEVEEDPMLVQMPDFDFKAYRRADISSFYQEPPGSRTEKRPAFQGQAGKFVNMSPERLDLYWDSGHGPPGSFISRAGPFESTGTSTFPGHVFYFIATKTEEVVCSFSMKQDTSVYYCDPFIKNDPSDPSVGVHKGPIVSLENLDGEDKKSYDAAAFNREFAPIYKNFTGGSEWLGNFPSEPPRHHMWRADFFGQEHQIQSKQTHFVDFPPEEELGSLSIMEMGSSSTLPLEQYREPGLLNMTIKAVSVAPRIFQIDNFLSDVEVDHLLDLAMKKNLAKSTTGIGGTTSSISSVRTSRTTWLPRHTSPIMDAIMKRAADVLKIDEALLRHRTQGELPDQSNLKPMNEDLQIVHYAQGQQYTAHHDFGFPDTRPNTPSRSINLCMYLNEGMVGGETAFPRWRNAETDDAVKAVPKKGKAMIFYMKNPDGNLDDLSQHAAMPVIEGEKWFANLWTWDPLQRDALFWVNLSLAQEDSKDGVFLVL